MENLCEERLCGEIRLDCDFGLKKKSWERCDGAESCGEERWFLCVVDVENERDCKPNWETDAGG